MQMCKK